MRPTSVILLLILIACSSVIAAAEPKKKINFTKDIAPILNKHCSECHSKKNREGGLRFVGRKDLFILNDSGNPAVVAGKSAKSELIHRIVTKDEDERMPPEDEGEQLSKTEVDLLKKWIDQGAVWSAEGATAKHWAYVKPTKPAVPDVKLKSRVRNPIDAFVLSRLEKSKTKLTFSPQAEPAKLLRRVYLDLIGLPPSPEEVDVFLKDPSQKAYERVVDRLLKSPRYGEKWARQWLDLARYADSNGFQADQFRDIWLYRDWVINAMNKDMPFDQFTIEQIAGDLLPKATFQQQVATGFHRCTTCNVEAGVDPEENRTNQIFDRVNTTGIVWLGTTFTCAQCHNHKYDPFTQKDYYQLFAFFNNTPMEVTQLNGNGVTFEFTGPKQDKPLSKEEQQRRDQSIAAEKKVRKQLTKRLAELKKERLAFEETLLAAIDTKDSKKIPKLIQQILLKSEKKRSKKQLADFQKYHEKQDEACVQLRKELKVAVKTLTETKPDNSLVMVEMTKPRQTNIFKRGNFLSKGIAVKPNTPDELHPLKEQSPRNRLALAKWLVSKENPLVARVTVNRWWAEFFGQGIVTTEEDFGTQGERPTHPLLLDWLAVEFMEQNWSMKKLHKTIVMSSTYQQSSKISLTQYQQDRNNKLLARGARLRLSAESIRDNALAISGLLSAKMGGAPVYPPQPKKVWRHVGRNAPVYKTSTDENRYRRGIYVVWRRSAPYPSFINFDAQDRGACVIKRSRTNTPLQALTLLNDPAYLECALGLAKRLATKGLKEKTSDRERIEYGFRLAISRKPTEQEISLLLKVYQSEWSRFQKNPQAAGKLIPQKERPNGVGISKMAAWFYVANILLNLDETITKG